MATDQSWRLTDRERRQAFSAALAVFSTVLGPLGPLAVWGLEYIYDRRDLIFNVAGAPVSAYTADRSALNLTALSNNIAHSRATQSTLSIDTSLTDAARKLGLRNGDPVSLTVTGHRYIQSRSGMVVPTRIGDRVNITVPSGSYSIAAFGSRQDNLFSTHDPYTSVAGDNITAHGRRQLALPLTPRAALASTSAPAVTPSWPKDGVLRARTCPSCGLAIAANPLNHALTCTRHPAWTNTTLSNRRTTSTIRPPSAKWQPTLQPGFQCGQCYVRYITKAALDNHLRAMHPFITWLSQ